MKTPLFCILVLALLPALPQDALSADPVGSVREVKVYAYGTPPAQKREVLYKRSNVFMDETLETVKDGGLRVVLKDDSHLVLGSDSTLIVDSMVYDAGTKSGRTNLSMRAGFYRYAAAFNPKRRVTMKTPTATIGIRGTDLTIIVERDGTTHVKVAQGSVRVASRRSGTAVTLAAGQQVTVQQSGGVTRVVPARGGSGDFTVDMSNPYRPLQGASGGANDRDDSHQYDHHYSSGGMY